MTNITIYTHVLHAIVLLRAATASWRVSLLFPVLFRVPGLQEFFEEEYRYRRRAYFKKYSVLNISISTGIFCLVLWNLGYNRSLLALAGLQMRLNWGKSSDDTTRTVIIAYFHGFCSIKSYCNNSLLFKVLCVRSSFFTQGPKAVMSLVVFR